MGPPRSPLVSLALGLAACSGGATDPPAPPEPPPPPCAEVELPVTDVGEVFDSDAVFVCVGPPRADGSSVVRVGEHSLGAGTNGHLDPVELGRALGAARIEDRVVAILADARSLGVTSADVVAGAGTAQAVVLASRRDGALVGHTYVLRPELEGDALAFSILIPSAPAEPPRASVAIHLEPGRVAITLAATLVVSELPDVDGARDLAGVDAALREHDWPSPIEVVPGAGVTYADALAVCAVGIATLGPDPAPSARWSEVSVESLASWMGMSARETAFRRCYRHLSPSGSGAPARLRIGALQVRGARRPSAEIERVVSASSADLACCFAAEPGAHGGGWVMLTASIHGSGEVGNVRVHGDVFGASDYELHDCLREIATGWRFPESASDAITDLEVPLSVGE